MATLATRAASARHHTTDPWEEATAVPTSTGTNAAGRVRTRAPVTQRFVPAMAAGKLPAVPRLLAIDATGDPEFVDDLRRAWDDGDAVLPVDPRLPEPARRRVMAALGAGLPIA